MNDEDKLKGFILENSSYFFLKSDFSMNFQNIPNDYGAE